MESIAILINGALRNHVDNEYVFKVIENLRQQFSFIPKVHIYFATWKPSENAPSCYQDLSEEYLVRLKNSVDFLYLFEFEEFDKKYSITREIEYSWSEKTFRMFLQVHLLFKELKEKYTYICRCRNDIIMQGDFRNYVYNIQNNVVDYFTTMTFWTYNDCITDQFCISSYNTFKTIWGDLDKNSIYDMFVKLNCTPEKMVLKRLQTNNVRYMLFIPDYYLFKNIEYVKDGKIIVKNTVSYMKKYLIKKYLPLDLSS